jgi:hypothetical protein
VQFKSSDLAAFTKFKFQRATVSTQSTFWGPALHLPLSTSALASARSFGWHEDSWSEASYTLGATLSVETEFTHVQFKYPVI